MREHNDDNDGCKNFEVTFNGVTGCDCDAARVTIEWIFPDGRKEMIVGSYYSGGEFQEDLGDTFGDQIGAYNNPQVTIAGEEVGPTWVIRPGSTWDFELHDASFYDVGQLCIKVRCTNGVSLIDCIQAQGACS